MTGYVQDVTSLVLDDSEMALLQRLFKSGALVARVAPNQAPEESTCDDEEASYFADHATLDDDTKRIYATITARFVAGEAVNHDIQVSAQRQMRGGRSGLQS